jgi:hypothetical protein
MFGHSLWIIRLASDSSSCQQTFISPRQGLSAPAFSADVTGQITTLVRANGGLYACSQRINLLDQWRLAIL